MSEGRKRWVVRTVGTARRDLEPFNASDGMYWTGRESYPMWTYETKEMKTFGSKDEAETALFLFVLKHPEWMGDVWIDSYMEYGPRVEEVGGPL